MYMYLQYMYIHVHKINYTISVCTYMNTACIYLLVGMWVIDISAHSLNNAKHSRSRLQSRMQSGGWHWTINIKTQSTDWVYLNPGISNGTWNGIWNEFWNDLRIKWLLSSVSLNITTYGIRIYWCITIKVSITKHHLYMYCKATKPKFTSCANIVISNIYWNVWYNIITDIVCIKNGIDSMLLQWA